MLHIFIIPACSLMVNLQAQGSKAPNNFIQCELNGLFNGRIIAIHISPEAVALN